MIFASLISTLSYLVLIPFFLRIIFRYHRVAMGHPLFFTVLEATNPLIYPLARILPPSLYYDRATILFTWVCVFFINQMKLFFHPHPPFLEVLTILTCLDWLNRLIILYISLGVIRALQSVLHFTRALEIVIEQIIDSSVIFLISISQIIPYPLQKFLRKYPLLYWMALLFFTHFCLEEMMIHRLAW